MTPEQREIELEEFNKYWEEEVMDGLDDDEKDDSFAYDLACEAWMARAERTLKAS